MNMPEHVVETDVLVIGSGGAGCRAAIEAKKFGVDVLLVSKGPIGRSGLTPMTNPAFAAVFKTRDKDDSEEVFFKDMMEGGYFLNNAKLARIVCENASKEVLFLESLGVKFDRTEDGEMEQFPLPSHSKRRCCRLDDNLGRVLLNALRHEMRRKGVRILEDIFITELIKKDERIIGATGIVWDTGTFIGISTKAIIMATGGHEALYSFRTTTPRATGDGIAMALRAGAELMDMEFMQFNPYTIIYPQGAAGVLVPVNSYIMTRGGRYRNRKGEAFIDKWDPIRKEATTRDVKARAMFDEMTGGRGSKHGGVYLDLSGLQDLDGRSPKEILEDQGGMHHKYLTQFGVDILTDELEVAPAAHFGCGGIKINENAETSLTGLYAAGEVSGGVHGANRLDGASMPEIFVFGRIAGEMAACFSASRVRDIPPEKNIRKEKEMVLDSLNSANGKTKIHEAKELLEKVMFNHFGLKRSNQGMEKGLEKIKEMELKTLSGLLIKDKSLIGNYDWLECLEFKNMLEVAEVMAISSIYRKESRSTHYREDYPEMREEWCKNTIVQKVDNELKIFSREVVKEES